ncbi:MAG: glycosyltransferase family 39 protein [Candidatus Omnitrophica bacterium]|nr:glycosyltransferase family 39 protein [Candidatus Omnitrophota bacterium]MBU1997763.1 glycosyltransferase family 39 protein [Candidatus Omnitrophota bacterium]
MQNNTLYKFDKSNYLILKLFLLSICGILLVLLLTPSGLNLSNDSVSYIGTSKNILAGKGIIIANKSNELVPLPYFPPLVPITFSLFGLLNNDLLYVARILNAFCFGSTIFLVGFIVNKFSNSKILSLLASLFILLSLHLVRIHTWLWSEPLFYVFMTSSFLSLAIYYDEKSLKAFYISAICASLAFSIRYAGIMVVISNCLAIMLISTKKPSQRFKQSFIYGLIGVTFTFTWVVFSRYFQTMHSGKTLIVNSSYLFNFKNGLSVISEWFLPGRISFPIFGTILFLLFLIIFFKQIYFNFKSPHKTNFITMISGLYIISYVSFLLIIDLYTLIIFDPRIVSSLFIASIIFIFTIKSTNSQPLFKPNSILIYIVLVILVSHPIRILRHVKSSQNKNISVLNKYKNNHKVLKELNLLPNNALIYTNIPGLFKLFTSTTVKQIPSKAMTIYAADNKKITSETDEFLSSIISKNVFIVYFEDNEFKETMYSEEYLRKHLNIDFIKSFEGVSFYKSRAKLSL